MTTIAELAGLDELSPSDAIPIYSRGNSIDRRVSFQTLTEQTSAAAVLTLAEPIAQVQQAATDATEAAGLATQAAADAVQTLADAARKSELAAPDGAAEVGTSSGLSVEQRLSAVAATPAMFGIPLNSSGVDYTVQLQALLDTRNFVFPEGFTASCRTLYPRSNSVGDFKNARFTLMPAQPNGVPLIGLGDRTNLVCENSTFYGGIFDGNRANQTASGYDGYSGGDGGLGGILVHHAIGVRWYRPQTINCATDGITVHARTIGPWATTVVRDVHIHSPLCDNNARQGISVVGCQDMHFYDATCTGTNGKAPQAGIDLEGDLPEDVINVHFHGVTRCSGNVGRGVTSHAPGNQMSVWFDILIASGNPTIDFQVAFYAASGAAVNRVFANRIEISNGKGINTGTAAGVTSENSNILTVGELLVDGYVWLGGTTLLDIGKVTAKGTTTAINAASLILDVDVNGKIGTAIVENTTASPTGFPLLMLGSKPMTIDTVVATGPRSVRLASASNKTIGELQCKGTLQSYGLQIAGGSGNRVAVRMAGTLVANQLASIESSTRNDVTVVWENASGAAAVLNGTASGNRLKVVSNKLAAGTLVFMEPSTVGNFLHDSILENTSGATIANTGANNKVYGSWPPTINSAS